MCNSKKTGKTDEKLKQYQFMVESAHDAIFFKDLKSRYVIANKKTLGAFGLSREQVIGKNDNEIMPDKAEARKNIEDDKLVFKTGKSTEVTKCMTGADGKKHWFQAVKVPQFDDKGNIIGLVGIARDITEHKRTEEALQKSEHRFRSLVETTSDWVWEVDQNAIYTYASPKVKDLLGYEPEEIIGKSPFDLMLPDEAKRVAQLFNGIAEARKPFDWLENTNFHKDGRVVVLDTSGVPILGEDGNLLGYRGIDRDVTERKRAEETLRESEEKFRTFMETASDLMHIADKDGHFTYLNEATAMTLGYSKEEMIGMHITDILSKETKKDFEPKVKKLIEEGEIRANSIWVTKEGKEICGEITVVAVYDSDGEFAGTRAIFRDITERKRTEQALKESEERYKALFQAAAEGILVADIETRQFEYANPALCEMLGYTEEELKRMSVHDIHPKEDLEHVISEFEAQARGEKTLSPSIPCLRRDGTIMYADIDTAKVFVDGRKCNVGFFTDITERKKTEDELLFKSTLLEAQSETSIDGILVVDGEGKSILFNKRFGQMWNIPHKILDTRDDEKMLQYVLDQLKEPNRFLEKVTYLYAHKNEKSRDEIQFKDGKVFDRYSSPLIDSNGKHYGRIWYFSDITERKRAEEELQKAHGELEIRVEQRTADLAKAIKDLRNEISERKKDEEKLLAYQRQLRSLASELSLAEERLRRRIAADVHDHISQNLAISKIKLESLRQSVSSPELTKALGGIQDLIAQTIESTRSLTFELSPPVLYELGFEAAVEWLVRRTKEQYGLSTDFKDDKRFKPLDDNVCVFLFQAVRELLVNVAKHAQAQSVKVSIRRVGDEIRVGVEDDGVGFDVSQPHFRDYKTGGFGLFSIRERLGYIGGHLSVESKPGFGTQVALIAPISQEKENGKEKCK